MERKFVVAEIVDCHSKLKEITESELKNRFYSAANKWSDDVGWDSIRDILLHGDVEKGDGHLEYINECLEQIDPDGKRALAEARRLYDEKPASSPTRAEWEMFAHNFANAIYFRANEKTLAERILSMPIVPKEDK